MRGGLTMNKLLIMGIGAMNPQLRIQITPLFWQLSFAFHYNDVHSRMSNKVAFGLGPIAIALNWSVHKLEKTFKNDLTSYDS